MTAPPSAASGAASQQAGVDPRIEAKDAATRDAVIAERTRVDGRGAQGGGDGDLHHPATNRRTTGRVGPPIPTECEDGTTRLASRDGDGIYWGPRNHDELGRLIHCWESDHAPGAPGTAGASSSVNGGASSAIGPPSDSSTFHPVADTRGADTSGRPGPSAASSIVSSDVQHVDGHRQGPRGVPQLLRSSPKCSSPRCTHNAPPVARHSPPLEPLSQEALQQRIREINADTTLSDEKKNRLRQALFSAPFDLKQRSAARGVQDAAFLAAKHKTYSCVKDAESGELLLGCEHYPRRCKIKAACCGLFYGCRLCHDHPAADHAINRFDTETVLCMLCGVEQPVAEGCITPGCCEKFARHFCPICKFYDDTPGKDIYHCHDCGICRVGKGLGKDNFHCTTCNACVSMSSKDSHKCLAKSLDADCPICSQYLFTSTQPVVYMICGHTMHSHCFDTYTRKYYSCPVCKRALTDMSGYYRQIDAIMEQNDGANRMPAEFANRRSRILCNDCSQYSETKFDFVYHKCQIEGCGSYNTQVLEHFDENPTGDDNMDTILTSSQAPRLGAADAAPADDALEIGDCDEDDSDGDHLSDDMDYDLDNDD